MPASSLEGPKPRYQFRRIRSTELMDLPDVDPAVREEAVKGIEAISLWLGQRQPLLDEILRVLEPHKAAPLLLLELGAGNGHLARWISSELASRGYQAQVLATDLLPHDGVQALDCLDEKLPNADLYYSSLLLHHLPDEAVTRMLRLQASRARLGFVHFDLQRSFFHFYLAQFRIWLAGLPRINQIDALLSIQQGYTRRELNGLAGGLPLRVSWRLPFRWLLTWQR